MTATPSAVETDVIIGVDTHKDIHAAVAIDRLWRQLEHRSVATTKSGLIALLHRAQHLGQVRVWGIEGHRQLRRGPGPSSARCRRDGPRSVPSRPASAPRSRQV